MRQRVAVIRLVFFKKTAMKIDGPLIIAIRSIIFENSFVEMSTC
jgi:hypothetical protein